MSGESPNEHDQTPEPLAQDPSTDAAGEGQSGLAPKDNNPTQDDVDAALNAAGASDKPEDASASDAAPTDSADADGEVSSDAAADEGASDPTFLQADVDAALNAASASGEGAASSMIEAEKTGQEESAEDAGADGSPKLDSAGKPFDEATAMMEAAIAEEKTAAAATTNTTAGQTETAIPAPPQEVHPPPVGSVPLELPDFGGTTSNASDDTGIALLSDVDLNVKIELGRTQMLIEDVLKLGEGSVVELDKLAGDPVDVLVNERLVARGEVLVLNDNFCVRISEIVAGLDQTVEA